MNGSARRIAMTLALAALLGGCADKASLSPTQQSGENPPLPEARDFLMPPMQVPDGVGWKQAQAPKVAAGLRIEKIASELMHPRQLLVLPDGDVLVVESNGPGTEAVTTPKQLIANRIKNGSGSALFFAWTLRKTFSTSWSRPAW